MKFNQLYKKYVTQDVSRVVKSATTLLTLYGKKRIDEVIFRRGRFYITLKHEMILLTPVLYLSILYDNNLVFYFKDATDFEYIFGEWVEVLLDYEKECLK